MDSAKSPVYSQLTRVDRRTCDVNSEEYYVTLAENESNIMQYFAVRLTWSARGAV